MIGVENEHVVVIVDDALSRLRELSDDVHEGSRSTWRIVPRLPKSNGFEQFRLLVFYEQNLRLISLLKHN